MCWQVYVCMGGCVPCVCAPEFCPHLEVQVRVVLLLLSNTTHQLEQIQGLTHSHDTAAARCDGYGAAACMHQTHVQRAAYQDLAMLHLYPETCDGACMAQTCQHCNHHCLGHGCTGPLQDLMYWTWGKATPLAPSWHNISLQPHTPPQPYPPPTPQAWVRWCSLLPLAGCCCPGGVMCVCPAHLEEVFGAQRPPDAQPVLTVTHELPAAVNLGRRCHTTTGHTPGSMSPPCPPTARRSPHLLM